MKQELKLGVEAKDKVTGLKGIVTGCATYLYGCRQWLIVPQATNNKVEGCWFDEGRLTYTGKGIAPEEVSVKDPGPDFAPGRSY